MPMCYCKANQQIGQVQKEFPEKKKKKSKSCSDVKILVCVLSVCLLVKIPMGNFVAEVYFEWP